LLASYSSALDIEVGGLRTALPLHVLALPFLLAEDGRGGELAEAQLGLQAEQALAALDQLAAAAAGLRYRLRSSG
jgi:hypothetical protein